MLVDLRYHISSLAAIFLALGIGMVIGGTLQGDDAVVKEQERIISSLEQEFEILRTERKDLQNSLKRQEVEVQVFRQFHKEVLPVLINGLLKDRRIAVITTNETLGSSYEKDICALLEQAGAKVETSILFSSWSGLKFDQDKLDELMSADFEREKSWSTNLLTGLVEGLALGKANSFLPGLSEMKFLEYADLPGNAIDSIVLIGGSNSRSASRTELVDLPLSAAALKFGLAVIGVEPLNIPHSYISVYKRAGLTSIDNIDTFPGRVSLIYALAGRKKGHYGVKETAQALIPDLSGTR